MTLFNPIRAAVLALLGLVLGAGIATQASAISVDCSTVGGGCIGGIYTLDVETTAPNIYLATYTIDTSVPFSVGATTLVDINIKVANAYLSPTIVSGPNGILGQGPLTGSGCSGTNGGFMCLDLSPELAVGGVYTWKIQFGATALLDASEWHVGARYTAPDKQRGWVISETASPVPEPSAALIFGLGMVVAGSLAKRSPTQD
jgi:hypothetical protein